MSKQNTIMHTINEANKDNNEAEFIKPGTRGLLEIVDGMTETTNMMRMVR